MQIVKTGSNQCYFKHEWTASEICIGNYNHLLKCMKSFSLYPKRKFMFRSRMDRLNSFLRKPQKQAPIFVLHVKWNFLQIATNKFMSNFETPKRNVFVSLFKARFILVVVRGILLIFPRYVERVYETNIYI